VKAILLCAGYATRLRPLTENVPKPLLPLAGRPMLDWLLDRVDELAEVDEVHVVTNHKFAAAFERWAEGRGRVRVHDDGTTTNEDRLGAVGDIAFTIERAGLDDDLVVIAGDNLFDYSLADYVRWWAGKGEASAVAIKDVGDLRLARQYAVVELDPDDRIVELVEKPEHPRSTLAATATYLFHRSHVPLVARYLAEGNAPDFSGAFLEWLVPRQPVYGYRFPGDWLDIGDHEQLLEADNRLRARAGLAERDAYSIDTD
jgi:glucose-1-phosphate thymidylyltransferase